MGGGAVQGAAGPVVRACLRHAGGGRRRRGPHRGRPVLAALRPSSTRARGGGRRRRGAVWRVRGGRHVAAGGAVHRGDAGAERGRGGEGVRGVQAPCAPRGARLRVHPGQGPPRDGVRGPKLHRGHQRVRPRDRRLRRQRGLRQRPRRLRLRLPPGLLRGRLQVRLLSRRACRHTGGLLFRGREQGGVRRGQGRRVSGSGAGLGVRRAAGVGQGQRFALEGEFAENAGSRAC